MTFRINDFDGHKRAAASSIGRVPNGATRSQQSLTQAAAALARGWGPSAPPLMYAIFRANRDETSESSAYIREIVFSDAGGTLTTPAMDYSGSWAYTACHHWEFIPGVQNPGDYYVNPPPHVADNGLLTLEDSNFTTGTGVSVFPPGIDAGYTYFVVALPQDAIVTNIHVAAGYGAGYADNRPMSIELYWADADPSAEINSWGDIPVIPGTWRAETVATNWGKAWGTGAPNDYDHVDYVPASQFV